MNEKTNNREKDVNEKDKLKWFTINGNSASTTNLLIFIYLQ
jgi:hypothetical protein